MVNSPWRPEGEENVWIISRKHDVYHIEILALGFWTERCNCLVFVWQVAVSKWGEFLVSPSMVPDFKNFSPCNRSVSHYFVFSTASRKVLWRFVSGTLGIICLLLMTTLGFVLKNGKFLLLSQHTHLNCDEVTEHWRFYFLLILLFTLIKYFANLQINVWLSIFNYFL